MQAIPRYLQRGSLFMGDEIKAYSKHFIFNSFFWYEHNIELYFFINFVFRMINAIFKIWEYIVYTLIKNIWYKFLVSYIVLMRYFIYKEVYYHLYGKLYFKLYLHEVFLLNIKIPINLNSATLTKLWVYKSGEHYYFFFKV